MALNIYHLVSFSLLMMLIKSSDEKTLFTADDNVAHKDF